MYHYNLHVRLQDPMDNDHGDGEGSHEDSPADGAKVPTLSYCTDTPDFRDARAGEATPDIHGEATPDIHGSQRDSTLLESQGDTEDDEPTVNPEPPRELAEGHLIDEEMIGSTVFSKHWLFTTLMNLIQVSLLMLH